MNEMPEPLEQPKKNNTGIIIAVVVVVLLCCCCLVGSIVMYQYLGDPIMQALGLQ
jgi:hypothetical protein